MVDEPRKFRIPLYLSRLGTISMQALSTKLISTRNIINNVSPLYLDLIIFALYLFFFWL